MIEVNENTRTIILERNDSRNMAMELEAAFMVLDTKDSGHSFSLQEMKKRYPQMARLYSILAYNK